MQETESMDLKHSDTLDSVGDAYIPNSKSTDLIKPSKSGNLDNQQPPGERGRRKKSLDWMIKVNWGMRRSDVTLKLF